MTLEKISKRHAARLFQLMGAKGYKTREPIEIEFEEPVTTKHLLKIFRDHHHYSDADLQRLIFSFDPQYFSDDFVPAPQEKPSLKMFG